MPLSISKRPIIAIGCHRSGTSLVSEILVPAGVDMSSKKDHFEDIWFVTANENNLAINGASRLELFPGANVIWVHHNGIDVANSLMARESIKNPQNPLLTERCLSYTGALTLWGQHEKCCALVTRDLPKDRILHLCFEQLCANPQQEISKMFLFCGLSDADIDFNRLPEVDDSPAWAFSN
jgi:hypothetical protein